MIDDKVAADISAKLNVLIALSLRQMSGQTDFGEKSKRKGVGEIVLFLAELGMDPKDIAKVVGSPITSVRTLLTPKRRK
jgi:hypothetical protein